MKMYEGGEWARLCSGPWHNSIRHRKAVVLAGRRPALAAKQRPDDRQRLRAGNVCRPWDPVGIIHRPGDFLHHLDGPHGGFVEALADGREQRPQPRFVEAVQVRQQPGFLRGGFGHAGRIARRVKGRINTKAGNPAQLCFP
jgi:hypothetical protein